MTEVLLNVRNLRVEFLTQRYTTVAVDDVSFDVREGEILGVVGEFGSRQVEPSECSHRTHRPAWAHYG